MNGAVLSVLFNIAEGFVRRRDRETKQFLRYAMASNGELKAAFYAADGRAYLMAGELAALLERNDYIARMLRRWYATLRD
jgi:four helix bundle protein